MALGKKGDALVLSITDEGRGVPADFAPQKSKGLGMRIVLALATQLNAELTVKRRNKGTSFELRVPLNQPLENNQTLPQPRDRGAAVHNAANERNDVPAKGS